MSARRLLSITLIAGVAVATFFIVRALNDPQRKYRESGKYSRFFDLEGTEAPPFEAKIVGADRKFTRDEVDRPTLFVFFATFCPHCKQQMPIVREVAEEYGDRVRVYAVNGREFGNIPTDEREQKIVEYLNENSWADIPVLIAPTKMQSAFNVPAVPSVVVFDSQRRIHYVGMAPHNRSQLEMQLDEVL